MKHPRRHQFADNSSMHGRWFEKHFLLNRRFNALISWAGKIAMTLMIWPRFVAPFRWQLTRYDMPLPVGPAFDGYKILHLTDLHAGRTRTSYLQRVARAALAEKPDIIVITGDLIDYDPKSLQPLRSILQILADARPPDGILAIFGNHDYHEYSWRKVGKRSAHRAIQKRLVTLVQEMGIRLLRNDQFTLTRPRHPHSPNNPAQDRLTFVGLDEMWADLADPHKAFASLSPSDPIVCLQHNPDGVEFLKPFPWQYMLTGHSHGGQAVLPLIGALYVPMEHRHYLRGFFDFPAPINGSPHPRRMFVSRGLGYSTPIRLFCPPEATLFTVRSTHPHG
jgi:predicted MPP superfamily phosphohydrolase